MKTVLGTERIPISEELRALREYNSSVISIVFVWVIYVFIALTIIGIWIKLFWMGWIFGLV